MADEHDRNVASVNALPTERVGGADERRLKPCPWCGPKLAKYAPAARSSSPDLSEPSVRCPLCRARGPVGEETDESDAWGDAEEQWNARAPLATDEELRLLQADSAYEYARASVDSDWALSFFWRDDWVAKATWHQRRAATLSALERRLRGVES